MENSAGTEPPTHRKARRSGSYQPRRSRGNGNGKARPLDWIIRAGAVATAIAAIVGVVKLLLPDPTPPPARLGGALSDAQLDKGVTLAEYMAELKQTPVPTGVDRPGDRVAARGRGGPGDEGATGVVPLASISLAAEVLDEEQQPSDNPPGTAAPEGTTETEPSQTPTTPEPGAGTTTTPGQSKIGPFTQSLPELPANPDPKPGCQRRNSCPSPPAQHFLSRDAGDENTVRSLAGFRTEKPVPANLGQLARSGRPVADVVGRYQPIGVRVNFGLKAQGYPSKRLTLRWSLLDARHGGAFGGQQFFRRIGMLLTPSALEATVNEDVWVPLPRRRGLFKVRLELFDPDNTRLDYLDSATFR
jgi:hypothetical protein